MASPIFPDLFGKHVVLTGGSNGIGAALARAFAAQGCLLTLLDLDEEAGHCVIADCCSDGLDARLYTVDLSNQASVRHVLQKIVAERPAADIVIANAGIDPRYELLEMSDEEWDHIFQINVSHYFALCRALLPAMIARSSGGSIIMTTSHTAWLAKPNLIAYNASKAAVIGLVRGLAEAVGQHHIRVNGVAPGWTMTERQMHLWVTPEALTHTVYQAQVIPKVLTPEALVGTYLFLASDCSQPLTRQVLVADYGQSKH